jgi:hypothetical protein
MTAARRRRRPAAPAATESERILGGADASLLDIVDNVLSKGVVLTGDVTIALAQVDLIYARLSLLLCAADRVMPEEDPDLLVRHSARRRLRAQRRGA